MKERKRKREMGKKATRIFPPFEDAIERRLYGSKEEELGETFFASAASSALQGSATKEAFSLKKRVVVNSKPRCIGK